MTDFLPPVHTSARRLAVEAQAAKAAAASFAGGTIRLDLGAPGFPMFVVDESGRILEVNDAGCFRVGYSRDDLLALPVPAMGGAANLVHGLTPYSFQELFADALRGAHKRHAWICHREGDRLFSEGLLQGLQVGRRPLMFVVEYLSANDLQEVPRLVGPASSPTELLTEELLLSGSRALSEAWDLVRAVSRTNIPVLLQGETGTGKTTLASCLHRLSGRGERPFVVADCAALAPSLLESELFGYEKGAFTGATQRKPGRIELAQDGTLLLDEIAELSPNLQGKLLRFLQSGEFERVGGVTTLRSGARIVAATNRDLVRETLEGRFRSDLFHRLNVFPIRIPSLRERREDLPALIQLLLERHSRRLGVAAQVIPSSVLETLVTYSWPGNIRELEAVLQRALVLAAADKLHVAGLLQPTYRAPDEPVSRGETCFPTLEHVERRHISLALQQSGWRVSGRRGAAALLGLRPTTLEHKMKRLGISRPGAAGEHADSIGSDLT